MAGMPRRISDYPEAFTTWNYLSSIGSIISFTSLFIFFYMLYRQFISSPNSSISSTFYNQHSLFPIYDILYISPKSLIYPIKDYFNIGIEKDIEHTLSTPPTYHHYLELPLL